MMSQLINHLRANLISKEKMILMESWIFQLFYDELQILIGWSDEVDCF